jgi:RNase P subunit RPR2
MPRFNNKVFKRRKVPRNKTTGQYEVCEPNIDNHNLQQPSPNNNNEANHSSSKKKLSTSDYSKYNTDDNDIYQIIHIKLLSEAIKTLLCKNCMQSSITVNVNSCAGLASNFSFVCKSCDFVHSFSNSEKVEVECNSKPTFMYDVNIRLAYGLRSIGKGKTAAQTFFGIMNLPKPYDKNQRYTNVLLKHVKEVSEKSMSDAVKEAVEENNTKNDQEVNDIPAAFDGTWQKRGHQSLNGVVTATSVDTGKVIDVSILSKYCHCQNKDKHDNHCSRNYNGSSGGMEVSGVQEIFSNSLKKYNVRYTNYLGDGDSKSYNSVVAAKPYGDDVTITKLECVGHIQKRLGARLRKLKLQLKGKKLDDNLPIGGRNRLTDATIDQLQTYYGMAIRNNVNSVDDMKKAIWAIYFHKLSTNDQPMHGLCPSDPDTSWCKYNKSLIGGPVYNHTNSIPSAIMAVVKPIFKDLANPNLLKKCLHGKTQNCNESVNSVIWTRIPKNVFVGMKTLQFGVYDAVACFNKGHVVKCEVFANIGMKPGYYMVSAMKELDKIRVKNSEKSISDYERKARRERRHLKRKLEDNYDNHSDYEAGMY